MSVLGKGGYGKVYRAVLEGPGGFHKDVAVKLLRDEDVPDPMLSRFREEARILGMVRDRAIVSVDPPTRLAGKWALVMEYVEGASLQRLMSLGPVPPAVAAEIVQEIARVLDKVYRAPGVDGQPLRILHRDVKPANVQITADGEVKVLDFGLAKVDYTARSQTTAYVSGTKGYVAPERLEGVDTPAGDVFSLGVTLHFMITGERPAQKRPAPGAEDPATQNMGGDALALMSLAARMRSTDPSERPSAREVEEATAKLRRRAEGDGLRVWAERTVPRAVALKFSDELVGAVLDEELEGPSSEDRLMAEMELLEREYKVNPNDETAIATFPRAPGGPLEGFSEADIPSGRRHASRAPASAPRPGQNPRSLVSTAPLSPTPLSPPPLPPSPAAVAAPTESEEPVAGHGGGMWMGLAAIGTLVGAGLGGVTVVLLIALFFLGSSMLEPRWTPPPPVPLALAPTTALPPINVDLAPGPGELVTPDLAPAVPMPNEPPPPRRGKAAVEPPDPMPPVLGAPTRGITFSSVPIGTDVYVDGRQVGQTPLIGVPITEGTHEVKLVSDAETIIRRIEVGRRQPVRYVWKGGSLWELHL